MGMPLRPASLCCMPMMPRGGAAAGGANRTNSNAPPRARAIPRARRLRAYLTGPQATNERFVVRVSEDFRAAASIGSTGVAGFAGWFAGQGLPDSLASGVGIATWPRQASQSFASGPDPDAWHARRAEAGQRRCFLLRLATAGRLQLAIDRVQEQVRAQNLTGRLL
jgi:hypothetical protein